MAKTTSVPVRHETRAEPRVPALAPWSRLGVLRDEIDRLFGSFEPGAWFDRPFMSPAVPDMLVPAMDLTENGAGYALKMELPGIEPGKVDVKLANGTLTVSAEKTEETKEEGEDFHVSERRWGSFRRSVRIPDDVDREHIEANCANGVLSISLPKSEAAKAAEKTIKVKAA
jgi:HSP20 family protein